MQTAVFLVLKKWNISILQYCYNIFHSQHTVGFLISTLSAIALQTNQNINYWFATQKTKQSKTKKR